MGLCQKILLKKGGGTAERQRGRLGLKADSWISASCGGRTARTMVPQSRAVANEQMGIGERHVRVLENRKVWVRQVGQ